MKSWRSFLRHALRAVTAVSGIGIVAVLGLCGASWTAGQVGCHLKPANHFQIIERDNRLSFFSDDWPDAKSNPAPSTVGNAPGIPIGRRFDGAILGFDGHYCELPSASRTLWWVCLPTRAVFAMLLAISVASYLAQKRPCVTSAAGRAVNPPAPDPDAPTRSD
jgi:hypothetical protein